MRTPDPLPRAHQGPPRPWASMGEWLTERLGDRVDVAGLLAQGRFVGQDGAPVAAADPYRDCVFVWFHRDLPVETPVPGTLHVVHQDERVVVVDKPPFLSTIPRGQHVLESLVVRLRDELALPELSPAHRLDRVTSGLVVLTTQRRFRGAYQSMLQDGRVRKTYRALAPLAPDLALPVVVRDHLATRPGRRQGEVVPGAEPNAETLVELERVHEGQGVYRLTPRTGRTHQLRLHMLGLGLPLCGDPLYPVDRGVALDDFSTPLQLLAAEVAFDDPVDGAPRRFTSVRQIPVAAEGPGAPPVQGQPDLEG